MTQQQSFDKQVTQWLYRIDEVKQLLKNCRYFHPEQLFFFEEIGSTNSWLIGQDNPHGKVCVAEVQNEGKGRRARTWFSGKASSILMSLGWKATQNNIQGLSLVSALAVCQALKQTGVHSVGLKWPNDVLLDGKKLAGILVEVSGDICVIGIGINLCMDDKFSTQIKQDWTDLQKNNFKVDPSILLSRLIISHERYLDAFNAAGFVGFVDEWNQLNHYFNKPVNVTTNSSAEGLKGICLGVNNEGALLVECDNHIQIIHSGEVSIRQC